MINFVLPIKQQKISKESQKKKKSVQKKTTRKWYKKFLKFRRFEKKKVDINTKKNKKLSRFKKKNNLSFVLPSKVVFSYPYKLSIKVACNNIFCTISSSDSNQILSKCSFGKYDIKVSKRNLNFNINKLFFIFFKEKLLKKNKIFKKNIIVFLTAPIRLRQKIIKQLRSKINNGFIIKIFSKKCFNGCKVSKLKKKKKRGFRVFK
jgi:hypothetical protein